MPSTSRARLILAAALSASRRTPPDRFDKAVKSSTPRARLSTDALYFRPFRECQREALRVDPGPEHDVPVGHRAGHIVTAGGEVEAQRGVAVTTGGDRDGGSPATDLDLADLAGLEIHPDALTLNAADEVEGRPRAIGRQELGHAQVPGRRRAAGEHGDEVVGPERQAEHARDRLGGRRADERLVLRGVVGRQPALVDYDEEIRLAERREG